ncbi:MAG: hydroxymethylbilane synthase [Ignavibacteriae bacterium]|nr:MAG: hydroxymethylbilane synthase [Ignavibacteriota bacterium]
MIIGTRGSELALWQTNWVKAELEKHYPELSVKVEIIKTTGDKILDVSLSKIGDKGLFTKEIENALLDKKIDLAVHSLKDLPTVLPRGLQIGAVSERIDQRDAFISYKYKSLDELPDNASVATGSLRRKSQLLNYKPLLNIIDIRGNLQTRFKKFEENGYDAMILAYAGVKRLGMDEKITQVIPVELMLPAVSQGVMAVEIREGDDDILELLSVINNKTSEIETSAERSMLNALQGGCQVPIGVYSYISDGKLIIEGMVASIDGRKMLRDKIEGDASESVALGKKLAEKLKAQGAEEILTAIRNETVIFPGEDIYKKD